MGNKFTHSWAESDGRMSAVAATVATRSALDSLTHFSTKGTLDVNDNGKEVLLSDSGQIWQLASYSPVVWSLKTKAPGEDVCDFAALGNVNLASLGASLATSFDLGSLSPSTSSAYVALCHAQTTATENGIYLLTWNGSAWTAARVAWRNHNAQCGTRIVLVTNGSNGPILYGQLGASLTTLSYSRLTGASAPTVSYSFNSYSHVTSRSNFSTAIPGLTALSLLPKDDDGAEGFALPSSLAVSGPLASIVGTLTLGEPHYCQFPVSGAIAGTTLSLTGTCGIYSCAVAYTLSDTTPSATISSGTITLYGPGGATEVLTFTGPSLSAATIPAATFYDPVNGNDSNAGTSAAAPKKTIPATFADLASIAVSTGTIINGALVADKTKRISVRRFGVGPNPILYGDIAVNSWTKLGGYTNIYYYDATVSVPLGSGGNTRVIANGRQIKRTVNAVEATALAAMDADASETFYAADFSNTTPGTVRVYLRNAGGTAPANGRYRVSVAEAGIYCCGSSHVEGIVTYNFTSNNGGIVIADKDSSDNPVRRSCVMIHGGKHNGLVCGGSDGNSGGNVFLWATRCNGQTDLTFDVFFRSAGGATVDYQSTNDAIIADKNRPEYNTTGYQEGACAAHSGSVGKVGNITLLKRGMGYLSGSICFEGAPYGWTSLTVRDSLYEGQSSSSDIVIYGENVTFERNRLYGVTTKLVAPTCGPFALTDCIFDTSYNTSGTTYNGFVTPGGNSGASWSHSVTHCTFNNSSSSGTYRPIFYLGNSTPSQLGANWTMVMNGNLTTGTWTRCVEVAASSGALLSAGDHNVWINNTTNMYAINGSGMPLGGGAGSYQGGWFGTWAATDPNSVQVTPTFAAYSAPHAWASHNPFTEAGGSPSISLAAGPRVSSFPGGAWATQGRYQAFNDALWLAGITT